ncbi:MAG TPA: hypothetical protein VGJ30_11925 [Candidatus Angelobacter sp.]|jgi:hypothetical protein
MTIAKLWTPLSAILAISIMAGSAPAQTSHPKAGAEPPALVALHAIDDYEASLEAVLSHAGEPDFEQRVKASNHKIKLHRARLARDRVSDPDLHASLDLLLEEASDLWLKSAWVVLDPKDKRYSDAVAEFHADRNLVASEIATGKRGLLHDAVLKRYQK